jgi:hypothetical protein
MEKTEFVYFTEDDQKNKILNDVNIFEADVCNEIIKNIINLENSKGIIILDISNVADTEGFFSQDLKKLYPNYLIATLTYVRKNTQERTNITNLMIEQMQQNKIDLGMLVFYKEIGVNIDKFIDFGGKAYIINQIVLNMSDGKNVLFVDGAISNVLSTKYALLTNGTNIIEDKNLTMAFENLFHTSYITIYALKRNKSTILLNCLTWVPESKVNLYNLNIILSCTAYF